MKHARLLAIPAVILLTSSPVSAEMFGNDYKPCGEKKSTLEIVACVDAKTKVWDGRLNAAYRDLQKRISAGQRQPLVASEQAWIQYRDANCRFYGSSEGTIRQVQAAECVRYMTQERTLELEKAMKLGE